MTLIGRGFLVESGSSFVLGLILLLLLDALKLLDLRGGEEDRVGGTGHLSREWESI